MNRINNTLLTFICQLSSSVLNRARDHWTRKTKTSFQAAAKEPTLKEVPMRGRFMFSLALLICALLCATAAVAAQSTDPNNPTPLTSGEIAGSEIEERASYYFTFEGGPGEITAALAAKMKKGAKGGSVGVELLDASEKSLASALVGGGLEGGKEKLEQALFVELAKLTSAAASLGSDTKEKTARVKVKQKQPLILKLTVDQGVESFTLKINGAVEFAPADAADAATNSTDATISTGDTSVTPAEQTMPTEPEPTPEQTTPIEQPPVTDTTPATPPTGETQPTAPKPKLLIIPGKKAVVTKVPAKPASIRIPSKQTPAPQAPQTARPPAQVIYQKPRPVQPSPTPAKKPAPIKIPGKKQP